MVSAEPMQVLGGSLASVRFLVENRHAHVNAAAAKSGLTPLMCAALCNQGPNRVSPKLTGNPPRVHVKVRSPVQNCIQLQHIQRWLCEVQSPCAT